MKITFAVTYIGNSRTNVNLNPCEIAIFLNFTEINTRENIYINPLRARNALRQHFRVILYTLESAS